jgi:glycosyltransferase involved in cell wall biosynthesis
MKGFELLHAACEKLWGKRQDFELVATGEPAGQVDGFTRFTGWVSQEELPRHYEAADIVVVPTVAQEGLSRTSVEAMAAGKPVVACRIGGLPFTVADGGQREGNRTRLLRPDSVEAGEREPRGPWGVKGMPRRGAIGGDPPEAFEPRTCGHLYTHR